ncbi:hypothetical protein RC1_3287 [Rhodospirillum centenum SW]|uniref:Uncharacterized protein n=1 Tax=Rhodospirillum centenum (strain ATCC 51521 / SW) TaxID=414684 RepID=B6IWH5_RHOCS|nr:hypothetical protein RC1_3287 [Rhodospirillum centenum SW]
MPEDRRDHQGPVHHESTQHSASSRGLFLFVPGTLTVPPLARQNPGRPVAPDDRPVDGGVRGTGPGRRPWCVVASLHTVVSGALMAAMVCL